MKKDYFFLLDTETTQDDKVADFGGLICDRKGRIYSTISVLIKGVYDEPVNHPLFYTQNGGELWSKAGQDRRYKRYNEMLDNGVRMLASVNAVNIWIAKAIGEYNPILTAYNLPFDTSKCINTDIDLSDFSERFCLMASAKEKWMKTKKYRQFVLDNHLFNDVTKLGNMSYSYKAENMARFVLGNPELPDEPHTALEDAQYYELPILTRLVNTTKRDKWMNPKNSSWRDHQVNNWFSVK